MFKIISAKKLLQFRKVQTTRIMYFGFPVYVPKEHKYIVTTAFGVIQSSIKEPTFRGVWFDGKVNTMTPIAKCEFKGNIKESKMEI